MYPGKVKQLISKFWVQLLSLSIFFYLDRLILGDHSIVTMHDVFDQIYPIQSIYGDLVSNHGLFSWFPTVAGGVPSYASLFPPFHPLVILSTILPMWAIDAIVNIGLMFAAGYGMNRILVQYFGLMPTVARIAGLFFALNTQVFTTSTIQFLFLFPLFFVWTLPFRENESWSSICIRGVGIAGIVMLCHPAHSIQFLLPFQLLLIAVFGSVHIWRHILICLLAWISQLLFWAPTLYSLVAFLPFSHRASYVDPPTVVGGVIDWIQTSASYFFQYSIHSGTLAVAVLAIALLWRIKNVRRTLFCLGFSLLVIGLFQSTAREWFSETLLVELHLGHWVWVLHFLLTLLTAIYLNERVKEMTEYRQKHAKMLYVVPLLTLSMVAILGVVTLPIFLLNTSVILGIYLIECYIKQNGSSPHANIPLAKKYVAYLLSILLLSLPVQYKLQRTVYGWERDPYKRYFENHEGLAKVKEQERSMPFRVGTLSKGHFGPAVAQSYGLETVDARYNIFFNRYKEFFRLIIAPQLKTDLDIRRFINYNYQLYLTGNGSAKSTGSILLNFPLLLLSNTKYLLAFESHTELESETSEVLIIEPTTARGPSGNFPSPAWHLLKESRVESAYHDIFSRKLYVYKLKNTFERAFLFSHLMPLKSDHEVIRALESSSVAELREHAYALGSDLALADKIRNEGRDIDERGTGTVKIDNYDPDRIDLTVTVRRHQYLIVTNNFHPNWKATIDGREANIFRVNHTFQGIKMPNSGTYKVRLEYRDRNLRMFEISALIGFPFLILIILLLGKRLTFTK